ncbi:lamin tail domain-containing protein [Candidatus Peregrinibacteria bacterium]|nr:MAG: lamin tail domain-containing protein [Candidatus Peregrinibacteria bacterium]
MFKKLLSFFIFLSLCAPTALATPSPASSSTGCPATTTSSGAISTTLRISALYPNPNTGEAEWIEVTNTGTQTLDLANYTLEDATGNPWAASGNLEAGEAIQITGFSFQLNNSNETVTLKTSTGTQVDTWTYASSSKGTILYRNASASTSSTENTTNASQTEQTTSAPASTPTEWPTFSEAMPNPEGSDGSEEWIELYNPHSQTLNLNGLQLDDGEEGSSPHTLSGSLPAESYLLISIQDSHLNLNNTEDHVRLLGINNEILWDHPYSDPDEGSSLIAHGSSTAWTTTPTPGEENVQSGNLSEETEEDEETSSESNESDYQNGDLSEEVTVTEVFPNPEGPDNEEEWIELTNGGGEAVNLGNWTLTDASGRSYTFPDSTVIQAGETLVLYRTESAISLNNSNESLTLADHTGEVMSEVSFDSSQEDESYSEIQIEEVSSTQASVSGLGNPVLTVWQWVTPSPGSQNPVWKQIKGSVTEFDEGLLTLFDGISSWTFKTANAATDELLYEPGNVLLVQASLKDELYEVMHAELVQSATSTDKGGSFPWSTVLSITGLSAWGGYELYKRRKSILNFRPQALQ